MMLIMLMVKNCYRSRPEGCRMCFYHGSSDMMADLTRKKLLGLIKHETWVRGRLYLVSSMQLCNQFYFTCYTWETAAMLSKHRGSSPLVVSQPGQVFTPRCVSSPNCVNKYSVHTHRQLWIYIHE